MESYFVQDIHSGYGPIEYTAIPLEAFGPGARYTIIGRDGEEGSGYVAAECLPRMSSWDDYFYGLEEDDEDPAPGRPV